LYFTHGKGIKEVADITLELKGAGEPKSWRGTWRTNNNIE
jgi:hypothetical protein